MKCRVERSPDYAFSRHEGLSRIVIEKFIIVSLETFTITATERFTIVTACQARLDRINFGLLGD